MIYHAEPGENCYSFTARVIAMMIYKGEHRATLMFNGITVNVKSTSDPEDIVEKYCLIRKITD